jgi:hypothetical protein
LTTNNKKAFQPHGLTLEYKMLGTISIDELAHAVCEDIQVLKDMYNVRYITGSRLKLFVSDEFGHVIKVRRPGGGFVHYLNTQHYRPACKDYDL